MCPWPKQALRFLTRQSAISTGARFLAVLGLVATVGQILSFFHIDISDWVGGSVVLGIIVILAMAMLVEILVAWLKLQMRLVAQSTARNDPRIAFADAAVEFVAYLKSQQKHATVIAIRSSLSRLFHLMGLHEHRTRLGQHALRSATQLNDDLAKAEMFLDDIGWAKFLGGDKLGAIHNIKFAIELLDNYAPGSPQQRVTKALLIAKANRHLAMLADDSTAADNFLNAASGALEALGADDATKSVQIEDVQRDRAQILHARATLGARQLGVEREGRIQASDTPSVDRLRIALRDARASEVLFEKLGDLERQTKALILVERLYASIDDEPHRLETAAKREYLSEISGIDRGTSAR